MDIKHRIAIIRAAQGKMSEWREDSARVDFVEAHPGSVAAFAGRWLVLEGRATGRVAYTWREAVDDASEAPGSEARMPRRVGA